MSVEFQDFSVQVKAAINDATISGLYEAAGELRTIAIRKSPTDQGDLRNEWKYVVDESKGGAIIGNTLEYSIYQEFGTGEYVLNGEGNKGGWYIPEEYLSPKAKAKLAKNKTTIKGKTYYFTKGTKPKRMLYTAFTEGRNAAIRLIQNKLNNLK